MAGRSNPNPSGDDAKSRASQGSRDVPAQAGGTDESKSANPGEAGEASMAAAAMSPESSQSVGGQEKRAYEARSETGNFESVREDEEPHDRRRGTGHRRHDDTEEDDEGRGAWEPDNLADNVGSVATAATVVVGAALIEAELIPGLVIGAGAVLLGMMFPQLRHVVRPVLKTAVRAGMAFTDRAREVVAEAGEQVQDVVAEVQAEREHRSMHAMRPVSRRAGRHGERTMRNNPDLGDAIPA